QARACTTHWRLAGSAPRRSECSESESSRVRRSRTATAWRSTDPSSSTRRKRVAGGRAGASSAAPVGDGFLRVLRGPGALVVFHVHALALGVHLADALPALQLAQRGLGLLAVLLLDRELRLLVGVFLFGFGLLLLALAEGGFGTERLAVL